MTEADMTALCEELAPVIKDYVAKKGNGLQEAFDAGFDAVKGYVDRSLASFETRIALLEARGNIEYLGIHSMVQEYDKGNAVTHDGSLWIARVKSIGVRPGDGGNAWQLAVKRGASAR